MNVVVQIFNVIGSLGLFLYGMKVMSGGIQKAAGEGLQKILGFMTTNRFLGVLTGFLITAIIQSSSATTVMVVSFVNAGLLSLKQSIGVIMGANIGTTVTGWLVALLGFKVKITAFAIPVIGIGLPLVLSKKLGKSDLGEALVGFGLLFLGLSFLKNSVPDLKSNTEILQFIEHFKGTSIFNLLFFVLLGTVLTVVVQSSSAAMTITIAIAAKGWINFPMAAAIVLGENIGTTVTAYLASIGANTNAKRAARAHLLFNMLGVVWMLVLFRPFTNMIDMLIPGNVMADLGPELSEKLIPSHLALFHTLFNITNTLLLVWFVPQISKAVQKLVKQKDGEVAGRYTLKYISTGLQETSELNLLNAKNEITVMMDNVQNMFSSFQYVFNNADRKLGEKVEWAKGIEDYLDQMQEELSAYLIACEKDDLNATSADNVNAMIRIVDELESIGDSCYNLILLTERKYKKKLDFDESAVSDINEYLEQVQEFLSFIKDRLNSHLSSADYEKCVALEDDINKERKTFKKTARKRLQAGADVRTELLMLDIVSQVEHIGDHAINIAQALRTIK